jgi:hypothetical protein
MNWHYLLQVHAHTRKHESRVSWRFSAMKPGFHLPTAGPG